MRGHETQTPQEQTSRDPGPPLNTDKFIIDWTSGMVDSTIFDLIEIATLYSKLGFYHWFSWSDLQVAMTTVIWVTEATISFTHLPCNASMANLNLKHVT